MSALKTRDNVVERYWPNFLEYCMTQYGENGMTYWLDNEVHNQRAKPTIENFWMWYITAGPMGVKHKGRFYSSERPEYV